MLPVSEFDRGGGGGGSGELGVGGGVTASMMYEDVVVRLTIN